MVKMNQPGIRVELLLCKIISGKASVLFFFIIFILGKSVQAFLSWSGG